MLPAGDLILQGGTIVDGTGAPPFVGDVHVAKGNIQAVGASLAVQGAQVLDARGHLLTPGFVDIHTHYDGHATWTSRLQPSSEHGVTTVVMGNCGVGFAPCRSGDRESLIRLMEGVEDIPEAVMAAGLPWTWESFPDYLDGLSDRRFDVDIAVQLPHAPLRLFVMGERAMSREPAAPAEVARMRALTAEAIAAGAIGFSTSRSLNHKGSDGILTPSYAAAADELAGIAAGLADAGAGVLQLISDFDEPDLEFAIAERMIQSSGRPLSVSLIQVHHAPQRWRTVLDWIERANRSGMAVRGQVSGRPIGLLFGFRLSRNPFMQTPAYGQLASLPVEDRLAELRRPERRARILAELGADQPAPGQIHTQFSSLYEYGQPNGYEPLPSQSMTARAQAAGTGAAAFTYDLLTAGDGEALLYLPAVNFAGNSISAIRTMLASPYTVLGLGDGGAHVGLICDASLPTYMLERWSSIGRGDIPVETVVKALSADTAAAVGLEDRGVIAPGYRADLNVLDPAALALHRPEMVADLPEGGARLRQRSSGYRATIVAGEITYFNGLATGALPGRLVRNSCNVPSPGARRASTVSGVSGSTRGMPIAISKTVEDLRHVSYQPGGCSGT